MTSVDLVQAKFCKSSSKLPSRTEESFIFKNFLVGCSYTYKILPKIVIFLSIFILYYPFPQANSESFSKCIYKNNRLHINPYFSFYFPKNTNQNDVT